MKKFLPFAVLLVLTAQLGLSQEMPEPSPGWFNRVGRWSLGFQGGGNMWLNDFATHNISGGGDITLRYALTRNFSLGIMAGYDALLSKNTDNVVPTDPALQHTYIDAKAFSGDLTGWYHFNYGKPVSPYLYAGLGAFSYKRKVEGGTYWPENKRYYSIHIPVGVGLEAAFSKSVAFSVEVGGRVIDNWSDYYVGAKKSFLWADFYPTARAGLTFFFGNSPDDDSDADMLTDGYEKKIGTDPRNPDTDGDGLTDYEEVTKYHTDPLKTDTDGDGLSDGDEVIKYHTDPLKMDTDGDGLSDGDEVLKYHTDPLKVDTDGDGLSDGDEVLKYHTDPLKVDTDGDGLSDGDEVQKYKTDPLKVDTDGGTVSDGVEVQRGTNPLDPSDDVPKMKVEVGKSIVLEGVTFRSGSATLTPESENTLELAYETMRDNPTVEVEIRGYTDNVGKKASNMKLSQKRADSVKDWLVQKGIDPTRITTKGFGPDNPIDTNTTEVGRAKNRRIEFYRTK
jgi:outer membrane protein OmpA-like peptidoglycan-associated protein